MAGNSRSQRMRAIRWELWTIDPHCHFCGWHLRFEGATLDHLQPRSRGGTDDRENLALCCNRCNRRKGRYPLEECLVNRHRGVGLYRRHEAIRYGLVIVQLDNEEISRGPQPVCEALE